MRKEWIKPCVILLSVVGTESGEGKISNETYLLAQQGENVLGTPDYIFSTRS